QRTPKYASLLRVRAPCLRSFLRSRHEFKASETFPEFIKFDVFVKSQFADFDGNFNVDTQTA
ncbi:MAG: hypothetical protein ACD_74C00192G0001, partial [uncultured bacterium]